MRRNFEQIMNQSPGSYIKNHAFPAITDPHASLMLSLQFQLEQSQWWSSEKLLEQQLLQLKLLVHHAFTTVPYYQDMAKAHGLKLPESLTLDFFHKIPPSTRFAIQAADTKLESLQSPVNHGSPQFSFTSGSTGKPIRFGKTMLTHTFWLAFALRDHLWHEQDFGGKLAVIRKFPKGVAEAPGGIHDANWGQVVSPIFPTGPACALNISSSLKQQLDWLNREQPDYLLSYPTNLVALIRYASEQNEPLPKLKQIRSVSEVLTDQARQLFDQVWHAPVTDIYTCEEAGYLAIQCSESGHYHVQSENVLLEIVDEHGLPCPAGKVGQVLITTLHNYLTPLIRYEVGDFAEFGAPCSCGRGLPVIRKIYGRRRNRLVLPSGDSVFPYFIENGHVYKDNGVKLYRFQCIQHSIEELELRLVLERPLTETEQAIVVKEMQYKLGYDFRVRFSFLDEIPSGSSGKFEEFISLVDS
jgi:phenylacetate-CoA ligase